MTTIITCAGLSSRYNLSRPKYLLTLPNGKLFFEEIADSIFKNTEQEVYMVVLKQHNVVPIVNKANNRIKVFELNEATSGPAETIYRFLSKEGFKIKDNLYIRDCDSFFDLDDSTDFSYSFINTINLKDYPLLSNVASKSFLSLNSNDIVNSIVEKEVVSNHICVGGYNFKNVLEYLNNYNNDLQYISEVCMNSILNGNIFLNKEVSNYLDLGTIKEYKNYLQNNSTFFVDIDGTIFKNQSRLFQNNYSEPIEVLDKAAKYLLEKQSKGSKIIFVTSRPDYTKSKVMAKLEELGFKDITIIFNLPHSPRILINDISKTNSYPTASSINVPRNNNEFWDYM